MHVILSRSDIPVIFSFSKCSCTLNPDIIHFCLKFEEHKDGMKKIVKEKSHNHYMHSRVINPNFAHQIWIKRKKLHKF